MHESHIAGTVAAHLGNTDLSGKRLRIVVDAHSLHGEDSRASLAAHVAALVNIEPANVDVSELPRTLLCSQCAESYVEAVEDGACPVCGGPPLPALLDHNDGLQLEIFDIDAQEKS